MEQEEIFDMEFAVLWIREISRIDLVNITFAFNREKIE